LQFFFVPQKSAYKRQEHPIDKEKAAEMDFGTYLTNTYKKFKKKTKAKFLKFWNRESRNKEIAYVTVAAIYMIGGIALFIIHPHSSSSSELAQ